MVVDIFSEPPPPIRATQNPSLPPPPYTHAARSDPAGLELEKLALKRRGTFPSLEDAITSLGAKPPFSTFDREVLQLYLLHGTRPSPGARL